MGLVHGMEATAGIVAAVMLSWSPATALAVPSSRGGPSWPDCSGNGIRYADTRVCECFTCFTGVDCREFQGDTCLINDSPGNPLVFQEYWAFGPANETTTVSDAAYRSGYTLHANLWSPDEVEGEGEKFGLAASLGSAIKRLHDYVGNVNTKGYYIVRGNGGTQLIGAAMYGLSRTYGSAHVYAKAPYYAGYQENAEVIGGVRFCNLNSGQGVSHMAGTCVENDGTAVTNSKDIIEFVTVPNNPDNVYRTPVYPQSRLIYDMAYNWPHLLTDHTPTKNFDGDIMIFTLSKLSGHAGTRFGWALVKDKTVATSMAKYIRNSVIELSHDSMHRAFRVINAIADPANDFFSTIRDTMGQRRDDMNAVFANVSSFVYMSKPDAASFYVWLKCVACVEGGETAKALFERKTGIAVSGGEGFGYPKSYVRLHTVLRSHTWPLFLSRLARLD